MQSRGGGEGIWEAVCLWAVYELLIFYIFVKTFKPWLFSTGYFGHFVIQGIGASHLAWIPMSCMGTTILKTHIRKNQFAGL